MSWHVEEDRIPLARLAGLALEILRDQSVGLAVGRIPPAPLAESGDATAPGCCDNRLSRPWATQLTLALGPKWQVRQATRHRCANNLRRW
ncbi:MAG: hypothetical protein R6X18_01325 [Chloroflexota bacterium]|jgi:hypothetical protein